MDVARRPIIFLLILACIALTGGGCAITRELTPLDPKPLLVHLPGVAGDNAAERWYLSSLRTGGFDGELRLYDWTSTSGWITVLKEYDLNRAAARRLANELATFAADNPTRPIFITCDSGGAGPVVWTLEALPANVHVEAVVLLAPALSPEYDLSPALARVRQKMLVFNSPADTLVLGWGTRTYGTIDRKHVTAAGVVGFTMPPDVVDPTQYAKLQPMPYDPKWYGRYGNVGDHTGSMGTKFASGFIAPLLVQFALDAAPQTTIESHAAE